ncbi:MAG TPA: BTAD domain-containing putative transcriptional regulator [Longimicrobiales bacterium]
MIRLKTLGSLDLRAPDGTTLQPILRQPKRLALLAYLAIEKPGQFHRRDELLGLFWPESDLRGGRASLSQAIHFLRQYLGKDAIVNRGDEEIGIATDLVWCDARAFQEEAATRQFAKAMDLYGGQLLPSFFVGESDGFEQWLEQKRDSLQREAMRACIALADVAESAGKYGEEVEWLRRAIRHFPFEESLHRRLIRAYDLAGDRAAALLAYDELVETLRREFEAEPSAETIAVVQAVRSRSEARPLNERLPSARTTSPVYESAAPSATRWLNRRRLVSGGIAALLVTAGVWGALVREDVAREAPVTRIAVLFFNDASPNNELEHLAEGLTSALIDQLGQIRQVQVISENGVRPFRGDSIPIDSISRQLDVGTIVGGSISRSGDQLRVNVQIMKGSTGIVAHSEKFERPTGELFALLDDISGDVGTFLRESLGQDIKLERYQRETENVAAWQAVRQAEQLLQEVRAANSRADLAGADGLFEQIHSLLTRAAQLDKNWDYPFVVQAQAYERKAWTSLLQTNTDPARQIALGVAAANQALKRNGNSAAAYEARGRVLVAQYHLTKPTPTESATLLTRAEADLKRAITLDPDRARAESMLSALYESQGRFADARQAAGRALAADAYLEDANQILIRLFETSFEVGDDEAAGQWCDQIRRGSSGRWPAAYCDLVLLGWRMDGKPDARKALYILETFGASDPAPLRALMQPRLSMLAGVALVRAGDTMGARELLRSARAAAREDSELPRFEAALLVELREFQAASQLLAGYFAQKPNARARMENGRMFKVLRAPGMTRAAN